MKISFITTVFNEEKSIEKLLHSLLSQTKLPDEIIIVDGGSKDATVSRIKNHLPANASHRQMQAGESRIKAARIKFKLLIKEGNRSVGRNEAIKKATGDIIACSDSGNILDKKWIENITKPFKDGNVDVVAGYYKSSAKNVFQKCLAPYVLVMPDKVDHDNFLPATRSVAFKKAIWKKAGGFDERFSHNEDYVFANKLKEIGTKIVFSKNAIVNWIPRKTFKEAFIMFFRFALGDAESGIWRTTVLLLLARYSIGLYLIFLSLLYKSYPPIIILALSFITYTIWSIKKNYKYVKSNEAIKILPLLQLTADISVLSGTIIGLVKRMRHFDYFSSVKQNKFLLIIIAVYLFIMLFTLRWGIPNQNHPFPYHMDEWHQLQAVANTFRYGTPNTAGSANGTMFHFLLSGFYLIPFMLLKIIDPFSLQIDNLFMRQRVFEILRLQTIFFGALSIFILYKIAGIINASKKLAIFLFTITPIWLMLSGYFKYDIALIFWILLSIFFLLRFAKVPANRNFILAAIPSALAVAVKVSAMPLFILYVFAYFWFSPFSKRNIKYLAAGIGVFIVCLLLLGFPDTIFGRGNILLYLFENIIQSPAVASSYDFSMSPMQYLLTRHYPLIFGYGLILLFMLSTLFWGSVLLKSGYKKYKTEIFIIICFAIFLLSILPLQIYGGGNRSLVLLPFFALIISLTWNKLIRITKLKPFLLILISIVVLIQIYVSFVWVHMKAAKALQEKSSTWIEKNISKIETIGIENIPIYQMLPDIIQKEFYFDQYKIKQKNSYTYQIIAVNSKRLPSIVVITNGEIEKKLLNQSVKDSLLDRLKKEGYKKIAVFSPDFTFYRTIGNESDYYFSGGMIMSPLTTSIFKKY